MLTQRQTGMAIVLDQVEAMRVALFNVPPIGFFKWFDSAVIVFRFLERLFILFRAVHFFIIKETAAYFFLIN